MKVCCSINQGKMCDEPFCKYIYYSGLANKYLFEWQTKIKKELEEDKTWK